MTDEYPQGGANRRQRSQGSASDRQAGTQGTGGQRIEGGGSQQMGSRGGQRIEGQSGQRMGDRGQEMGGRRPAREGQQPMEGQGPMQSDHASSGRMQSGQQPARGGRMREGQGTGSQQMEGRQMEGQQVGSQQMGGQQMGSQGVGDHQTSSQGTGGRQPAQAGRVTSFEDHLTNELRILLEDFSEVTHVAEWCATECAYAGPELATCARVCEDIAEVAELNEKLIARDSPFGPEVARTFVRVARKGLPELRRHQQHHPQIVETVATIERAINSCSAMLEGGQGGQTGAQQGASGQSGPMHPPSGPQQGTGGRY